ncbi:MAG: hypothetical protein ACK2UK_14030 [Candidatus Promineifilaceae bacterium]
MRRILTWALWLIVLAGIVAAGYFAWRYFSGSEEETAGEQVIVTCSTECAERAQCGTTMGDEETLVVLGGEDGPVVAANQHDMYFQSGVTVEVKDSMEVELRDTDGRTFSSNFSRVQLTNPIGDIVDTGWIPEWCIERP